MALPASDSFNGTDLQMLADYSSNWSYSTGTFRMVGTAACASFTADVENGAYWNADTFDDDQYAQIVFTRTGPGLPQGAAVRCSATGDYYGYYGDATKSYLFRVIDGVYTALDETGSAFQDGDVVRLEVSGSSPVVLTPLLNGLADIEQYSDSSASQLTSGSAGICGFGATAQGCLLDSWEGGNLEAVSPRRIALEEDVALLVDVLVYEETD